MPTKDDKKKGLAIMCLGIGASVFFFWFFKLDGMVIDPKNPILVTEFIVTALSLICGLYFGLRFVSGREVAKQIGGSLLVLMAISYIIAFLRS